MDVGLPPEKVLQLVGDSGGVKIFVDVLARFGERRSEYQEVVNSYKSDKRFSRAWFMAFLYMMAGPLLLISVALIIVAMLIALALFSPGFASHLGYIIQKLDKIGWGGAAVVLLSVLLAAVEPRISLERFRHWLQPWSLERKLANRIKRRDSGYFRVQDENCEKLAEAMAFKLRGEPGFLTGMLIKDRPGDRGTLCNELFIGSIFEAMMTEEFGGDWGNFRPIQACLTSDGLPVCSPQVILREEPTQIVSTLAKAVTPRLSSALKTELVACLGQLKREWRGNALGLLSPPVPRPSLGLYLCLVSLIPALLLVLFQLSRGLPIRPWDFTPPFDKLYLGLWLLAIGGAARFILTERREWREWFGLHLRASNLFETILRRLSSFPMFREREAARVALAKFAYEYGVLDVPARELQLGSSLHVALALLKTKAVYFSGVDLREDDPDLWFFCESAMRRIALYLEDRLVSEEGSLDRSKLVGENLPYNIVDGFLFMVGYKYCKTNSCRAASDCPFLRTELCDSLEAEGFHYDREPRHLKRTEWPGGVVPPGGKGKP
jgi:hypothetical protein